VIKAYLHLLLDNAFEISKNGGNGQLIILPIELRAHDVEEAIRELNLSSIIAKSGLHLRSHEQIERLSAESLQTYQTTAVYSSPHRQAMITPIQLIRPAVMPGDWDPWQLQLIEQIEFSHWERMRGYGRHFFWIIEYRNLSLACCDGRGSENGLSLDWLNQNSLKNIKSSKARLLAVSSRGDILIRQYGDDSTYVF